MFSHIIRNVNVDVESSSGVREKIVQLMKLEQRSYQEYEGKLNRYNHYFSSL